jgi:uncharacterized protein (TIGR00730 family)
MNICVFCGSSKGNKAVYAEAATALGAALAARNMGLVYGGGKVGLMGIVANSVMQNGGTVTGIIPHFLNSKEGIAFDAITEVQVVDSMHERKMRMHELSNGVVAMPGGYGTLDELFEILTWAQLGLHTQPVGLLNVNNYFTPLVTMLDNMVTEGFLSTKNRSMLLVSDTPDDLLDQMAAYIAPDTEKWLDNVVL